MPSVQNDPLLQLEMTCGSLLDELQIIWDEVGESGYERDKILFELEQECLEVYRRKVDQANRSRAQLRKAIADSEAELAAICSAMGERPVHIRKADEKPGNLKEELEQTLHQLDEMRKRKSDRRNQFVEVLEQIQNILNEIHGSEFIPSKVVIDETDISQRKLEELHIQLHGLQKEKSDRLKLVQDHLSTLNSLCLVLGVDFKQTVIIVHPTFDDSEGHYDITSRSIEQLGAEIKALRDVKLQRMQRLQDLATSMLELWNLMDTPIEEQQKFQNVTCNIAASEHEITEPNTLTVDCIGYIESEVSRLEELKSSKMKELVVKKWSELEEICRKTHLVPEEDISIEYFIEDRESGGVDPACALEQIELQIGKVKGETFLRKEILEKMEKWLSACDEEGWLEEYNRDENRYNAGRGGHLNLKRAEKARSIVTKLPGMVEALTQKTLAWEKERGIVFLFDGVRLLSMLEEYTILRHEKEQELRRQRDQKKLQGQLMAEQEVLYGSKQSPLKPQIVKKAPRMSTGGGTNKRISLGGAILQTSKPTPTSRLTKKNHQSDPEEGVRPQSAGKRGMDMADFPSKKNSNTSSNARGSDSPIIRRPFSPIPSSEQQMEENTQIFSDPNIEHSETLQKATTPVDLQSFSSPLKIAAHIEENDNSYKTPKVMPNPKPPTPSTVSVSMQTAWTPAVNPPPVPFSAPIDESIVEEIEYSFEERRAGYMLPKTQMKSMIHV